MREFAVHSLRLGNIGCSTGQFERLYKVLSSAPFARSVQYGSEGLQTTYSDGSWAQLVAPHVTELLTKRVGRQEQRVDA